MKIEARQAAEGVQRRSIELRAAADKFEISARAIKYGAISEPIGGMFLERIAPGTFTDSLRRGDEVVCLYNHDQNQILGRTRTGALQIDDSATAMNFTCRLNRAVQAHRDLYELVKDGTISECSFAFVVDSQSWDEKYPNADALPLRTVTRAKLCDVSVVVTPAYQNNATMAEARKQALAGKAAIAQNGLPERIKTMRRAAQLFAKEIGRALRNDDDVNVNFASHLDRCHEYGEFLFSQMEQANNVLGSCDPDDDDCEQVDSDTRKAFAVAHAHSNLFCDQMATARLAHAKRKKKK